MNPHLILSPVRCKLFLLLIGIASCNILFGQTPTTTTIYNYVIFGGTATPQTGQRAPLAPGYAAQLGPSNTIQGGIIGSYKLVKTSGSPTIGTVALPTNIFSGEYIQLSNGNTVRGRIAAGQPSGPIITGTAIDIGSNAMITNPGHIDGKGNIVVIGGTVAGTVTHPSGTTYSGPGTEAIATPSLSVLPAMHPITTFPTYSPGSPFNFSSSQSIDPFKSYGNITLSGNKTLTFNGPGIYVINAIANTGTSNNFVFDFKGLSGSIKVYVHGNVDLGKIKASTLNPGSGAEKRVFLETHGTGASAADPVAFKIANGSAGNASKWIGTVWAPYAAINIGSGTGGTNLTGALWSGTQVNLQSGILMTFAPFDLCDASLSTSKTDVLCFGSSTGAINLTVSGGTAPYIYDWADLAGTSNPEDRSSIPAGTYNVTVTDANACTYSTSVTITQPASAVGVTSTKTDVLCFGASTGAINITASGGVGTYSYDWADLAGTSNSEDRSNIPAGTYNVTVRDGNGCTASTSVTVSQPASAVSITNIGSNAPICPASTLNLSANASGGTGAFSYSWSGPNGFTSLAQNPAIINASTLAAGTYNLTVTDGNGCKVSSTTSVTFKPVPIIDADVNDPNNEIALGFDGKAIIVPNTTAVVNPSYSWVATGGGKIISAGSSAQVTVASTAQITVASEGIYTLTVQDQSTLCASTDVVLVNSRKTSIIGLELQSIYESRTTDRTYFDILNLGTSEDPLYYVKVDIIAKEGKVTDVLNLLLEHPTTGGFTLDGKRGLRDTVPKGLSPLTITGRFIIDRLNELNDMGDIINFCRPYYAPILFKVDRSNSKKIDPDPTIGDIIVADTSRVGIRSEGDSSIKTNLVRIGYSVYGDGVPIGVMSDSYSSQGGGGVANFQPVFIDDAPSTCDRIGHFNPIAQTVFTADSAADIINRNIPSTITVLQVHPPIIGSDEGRAMLQIVHDLAPGSPLFFRSAFHTPGDHALGIHQLKQRGCKVVVDDVSWPTEPFLKDGVVARAVDDVKAEGVVYLSSAGNFGDRSYESFFHGFNFIDANGQTKFVHDFNYGGGSTDAFQKIKLAGGSKNLLVFQWVDNIYSLEETTGSVNDFDIFLTKSEDGSGLIGFNRDNTRNNELGGDPIEFIPITVPEGDSVEYNVFIVKNTPGAVTDLRIKLIWFRGGPRFMEYHSEGISTVVGHANAKGAIAVGASRFNEQPRHPLLANKYKPDGCSPIERPLIEPYSSVGGTLTRDRLGNVEIRQKPDMVGPDAVRTTVNMGGQDYPDWALDGYSNFKGTSAAAPHVAAAAALIIKGRQKFLGLPLPTTGAEVDEIKELLQNTAWDMETPGFDYISGAGLVDANAAMRTFAAPTPHNIKLVYDEVNDTPGEEEFVLRLVGENFSENTVVYLGNTKLDPPIRISETFDTIWVTIPPFFGNPRIRAYTEPNPETIVDADGNKLDGGFSNSLYFGEVDIVVTAVSKTIKFGQNIPTTFNTTITVGGIPFEQTGLTLADIGLDNMIVTCNAPQNSVINNYDIVPDFDPNDLPDSLLLIKYNYTFNNGVLSIDRMPVTVRPFNQTITYGQFLNKVTFDYIFDPAFPPTDPVAMKNMIKEQHEAVLPSNVLAVVKDFSKQQEDGSHLTKDDLANMNTVASWKAIANSRKFKLENQKLVPLTDPNALDAIHIVDVASESIYDYRKNISPAKYYGVYPNINKKALLSGNALNAKTATVIVEGNPDPDTLKIVNGYMAQTLALQNESLVPIVNDDLVQIVNGKIMEFTNGQLQPKPNEELVQIVNVNDTLKLVQIINGVIDTVGNNKPVQFNSDVLVMMVNDELVQIVNGVVVQENNNGELEQIVNEELVLLVNEELVQLVNDELVPLVNEELVMLVNEELVQMVNDELVQIVNGILVDDQHNPIPNEELVQIVNDELVQIVNNLDGSKTFVPVPNEELVQIVNEFTIRLVNDELVQIVNDELVQMVNDELVQIVNDELVPLVNNTDIHIINSDLVQIVNDELVQIVNGETKPIPNNSLIKFPNEELVQIVNDELVQIVNEELVQIVNDELVQIVNEDLVQIVNSGATGTGNTDNNTGVIIDEEDVDPATKNWLGPMFSVNMITGLNAGTQYLVPGKFLNRNFDVTYDTAIITINKAPITVKADDKSRLFGDPNPVFTVTFSGFQDGENLQNSGITGAPAFATTATATSPVSPPTYPITISQGTLQSTNYDFSFVNGTLTVLNLECLLTHSPFKNFGNTTNAPTSLWMSMVTKVSGQLTEPGDYLLFKSGFITFNFISSTPQVISQAVPDGKIIAVTPVVGVTYPRTYFNFTSNTWITEIQPGFASTSDLFVTGAIINSSTGFQKLNGNTSSVLKGKFYCNKNFSDQWAHQIAAYQKPPTYDYVSYNEIGEAGQIVSINGDYRAGTPLPILQYLVQGASGGGGNNYTGSKSSFDNYTACGPVPPGTSSPVTQASLMEETQTVSVQKEMLLMPNPASDNITLSFVPMNTGVSDITVFSIDGRKVMQVSNGITDAGNRYTKKIDVSKLRNGVYIVQLQSAGTVTTRKFVIAR